MFVERHLTDCLVDVFIAEGVIPCALAVVALGRELVGGQRRIVDGVIHVHLGQAILQLLDFSFMLFLSFLKLLKGQV